MIRISSRTRFSLLLLFSWAVAVLVHAGEVEIVPVNRLDQVFLHPTDESKPWVYWYWNNGNYSKEGVTADLEAMKQVGIAGCTVAITSMMVPKGPIEFGTPAWMDTVMHAIREAGRLGMKLSIMNCEGWGVAGGPWIQPETGQKKLVWTTTKLSGENGGVDKQGILLEQPETKQDYYRDVAVLAYPAAPFGRINGQDNLQTVDADWTPAEVENQSGVDALFDENSSTRLVVPGEASAERVVTLQLKEARTARAITIRWQGWTMPSTLKLEASKDGASYQTVVDEKPQNDFGVVQVMLAVNSRTFSFPAATAKYWRISLSCGFGSMDLVDAEITSAPRINNMEIKAAYQQTHEWGRTEEITARTLQRSPLDPAIPDQAIAPLEQVRNLSEHLDRAGRLRWQPPPGEWTVLRLGYTGTDEPIHPATDSGRGLECDKFDPDVVQFQLEQLVAKLASQAGPLAGSAYHGVWIDSWEAHGQNWSEKFPAEFKQRRGYDLIPYLPVLTTGQIIECREICERLLWDFRRTIADVVRENFFGTVRESINERGLKLTGEFAGMAGHLYDPINYMMEADIPVGEFWSLRSSGGQDIRVAASLAHTSGRPTVAAEAYTDWGGYNQHPYQLKSLGDEALCAGVNRFIFHTYSHQPWLDPKPGMSFGPWGIDYHRGNTWWDPSRQWITYLSRCQQLLREGQFVADICHYIGDDAPNFVGRRDAVWKPIPIGRDFDCINTEILKQLTVAGDRLVLPSGMSYRVLLLPDRRAMLPASLEIVESLVEQGAIVVGPPPIRSPSLTGYPAADRLVVKMAENLWGQAALAARQTDTAAKLKINRRVGNGRVTWGMSWSELFDMLDEPEDFRAVSSESKVKLNWIHRRTDVADIYFLANPEYKPLEALCTFRVDGRQPELWDPDSGVMRKTAIYTRSDSSTDVPIHFDSAGSLFVIFRSESTPNHVVGIKRGAEILFGEKSTPPLPLPEIGFRESGELVLESDQPGAYELTLADGAVKSVTIDMGPELLDVKGPWQVAFQSGRGAPPQVTLEKLSDLSQHDDPGVKYFSGTASYTTQFEAPSNFIGGGRPVTLDLGDVEVMAEATLNGKNLGIVWKSPFQLDVAGAVKAGRNELVVAATNLWVNRLVGDEQFPDDCEWKPYGENFQMEEWPEWYLNNRPRPTERITFFPYKHHSGGAKLPKSGLLGPVRFTLSPLHQTPASLPAR